MKVKICPACGTVNDIRSRDCTKCGADLADVTPAEESEAAGKTAEAEAPETLKEFRICPECGGRVPPNTWTCAACGGKTYGLPLEREGQKTAGAAEKERPDYVLRSEDGQITIRVREGETVTVGREAAGADYLAGRLYVGRKHLQIEVRDGWITLTDLASRNGSLVNGKTVKAQTPFRLTDNDLISMGAREGQAPQDKAAYFRISKAVKE